jgi:membrane-associated phospholipid phosphatase
MICISNNLNSLRVALGSVAGSLGRNGWLNLMAVVLAEKRNCIGRTGWLHRAREKVGRPSRKAIEPLMPLGNPMYGKTSMNGQRLREIPRSGESSCIAAPRLSGHPAGLRASEPRSLSLWRVLKNTLAEAWGACGAFEWLALGYLGATTVLIAIFAENLTHPVHLLLTQGFVASVILALCLIQARTESKKDRYGPTFSARWWHFWRHWYPHLFFLFCFEELAFLMTLVTPHWQDAKLIAFDYWLFGVYPSVWLEQFATPFSNDAMQLVYFTYFAYLLIVGLVLYVRRDWRGYWSAMTYSMAAYILGYFIAMAFPIEPPWFTMASWWKGPLAGGPFTAMMSFIERYGQVRGASFPSEHVVGATAALWAAWVYRRWLFWVLLPLYVGMCFSTIWGRYHYCADVFAGIIIGTIGYLIGRWIMTRRGAITTAPDMQRA